jgi:hypothetical protein
LNNSSGSYILNLRFGLTLAHIINYAWTSSDPANFPNVAIEQTLTNQLLTGVALGGSGSSISLVINGTAYSVAVQTSVFLGSGSPTSTTAVFAPIVLNYVSAAP